MSSSCSYCGAALKLNFCVVCGRLSKPNQMGSLRKPEHNDDETILLGETFANVKNLAKKNIRFKGKLRAYIEMGLGATILCILLYCVVKEATNLYSTKNVQKVLQPWLRTHRIVFPENWPNQLSSLTNQWTSGNQKNYRAHRKRIRQSN